ncbi:MAG TPA: hypothetical protein VF691_06450 [Cytophagaceae bacterium]
MKRILDYLILSFCITMFFIFGYVFTAATMVIFYATVYVMFIDSDSADSSGYNL